MKKALVTGAAGFIGSHVVRELLARNIEVKALIRPGEPTTNLDGLDVQKVIGDILDYEAISKALQDVDTLFHLAAIYAIWMSDWSKIYEVNMQGSRNVLWAAVEQNIEKVVYTSSIAAIGIAPGEEVSTEDTAFNQYTLGSHYVLTKYLSQQEALGFARNKLDLVVVNPAFPFGVMDRVPTPTGQIIIDIVSGINRFYYSGGINIVDVRDVARGHVLAAEKGRTGELYILGNKNISIEDFTNLVLGIANLGDRFLVNMPVPLLKTATSVLTIWSDFISHKPPLSTPVEIQYSSNHLYFDSTKAQTELGLTLTPIGESLNQAIEWFKENDYL
ncbi:SDR family oxidoreductase [candidate division CSSED10-310 bacterium]|uniref:SDR family oxidoreductase n=1 Tax=candidate division CSSED10-310 bacterium TaxID=2855610 RepID=A0ABV6Z0I9_UNCC1